MHTASSLNQTSTLSLEEGRDYESAKKSYSIALKYDKENSQILRDLGVVQMQLRDYEGACETNRQLVVHKPLSLHWLSFAAAAYMVRGPTMS